jgi:hypothetical protein
MQPIGPRRTEKALCDAARHLAPPAARARARRGVTARRTRAAGAAIGAAAAARGSGPRAPPGSPLAFSWGRARPSLLGQPRWNDRSGRGCARAWRRQRRPSREGSAPVRPLHARIPPPPARRPPTAMETPRRPLRAAARAVLGLATNGPLALAIGLPLALGGAVGAATLAPALTWYRRLRKPRWTLPAPVIGQARARARVGGWGPPAPRRRRGRAWRAESGPPGCAPSCATPPPPSPTPDLVRALHLHGRGQLPGGGPQLMEGGVLRCGAPCQPGRARKPQLLRRLPRAAPRPRPPRRRPPKPSHQHCPPPRAARCGRRPACAPQQWACMGCSWWGQAAGQGVVDCSAALRARRPPRARAALHPRHSAALTHTAPRPPAPEGCQPGVAAALLHRQEAPPRAG